MTDNFIPTHQQPRFLADASHSLAQAIHRLAVDGGIPLQEKQKAGEEAIALARKALEMRTQLHCFEDAEVALSMGTLASILNYFNNVDDDEILRLLEQAIAIYSRVEGSSSANVAVHEHKLGYAYANRADRAHAADDLDRCMANLELTLPHYREAARIYRVISYMDKADEVDRMIAQVEEDIQVELDQRQRQRQQPEGEQG